VVRFWGRGGEKATLAKTMQEKKRQDKPRTNTKTKLHSQRHRQDNTKEDNPTQEVREEKTRHGKTRQYNTRQDKAMQDKTPKDKARRDKAQKDKKRQGNARHTGQEQQDKRTHLSCLPVFNCLSFRVLFFVLWVVLIALHRFQATFRMSLTLLLFVCLCWSPPALSLCSR
jgi:hypothetical protein